MHKKVRDDLEWNCTYMLIKNGKLITFCNMLLVWCQCLSNYKQYRKVEKQSKADLQELNIAGNKEDWQIVRNGDCYLITSKDSGKVAAEVGIHEDKMFVNVFSGGSWVNIPAARELILTSLVQTRLTNGIVMLPCKNNMALDEVKHGSICTKDI